ncbi:MATE family efflux transporter [Novosphingobium sp. SG720]|uniref:MATE family efflux transporter n=1 Tax=Novosphingobium sp. SG720 TaxID=2586998 RepID=UPI001447E555|nr:MATE family efflux transporter [Novosphingobium sp. SG720]NKJ43087.1 MATE family multidrug resistance protein [Novosphingobium sp. SG720]
MTTISRRVIFAQAWPIIVGQALVPLVGIVDVAVIGRLSDARNLGGVALGATILNLVFWTFGFLRMGVTGITAQAHGARDETEILATILRGLGLGLALGTAVLALSPVIVPMSLSIMAPPGGVGAAARAFLTMRLFGAPAALGFYAINGWLLGLGRTRLALGVQAVMNGVNIGLDLLFVGGLGLGARGVGLGTTLAEWSALGGGIVAIRLVLGPAWRGQMGAIGQARLLEAAAIRRLVVVNADIMVRTLAMLGIFTWFTRSAAMLGPVPLAANHVLMQFVSISAFVLDGFAFTAEARVGAAIGAGSRPALLRAIRLTGEFSLAGGVLFSVLILIFGNDAIAFLTPDAAIRASAEAMLPLCAAIPTVGVASWLLDGIFIGAVAGSILRNAALVALVLYLLTDFALKPLGDMGIWLALLASYAYRAIALGLAMPALLKRVARAA